jgi:hypothetical protein
LLQEDLAMTAVGVVEMFARRWTIEQLFSVAKNQMGFDSAEVRKERSVLRHAALSMAMVTFPGASAPDFGPARCAGVEVWGSRFRHLASKTFSAKLTAAREEAVKQTIFASGPRRRGSGRIAGVVAELFSTATRAA